MIDRGNLTIVIIDWIDLSSQYQNSITINQFEISEREREGRGYTAAVKARVQPDDLQREIGRYKLNF